MPPVLVGISARAVRVVVKRANQRKPNLTGVRMAAEININAALGRVPIEVRRMGEQNVKGVARHGRESTQQIVTTVIEWVIDTSQPQ